MQVSKFHTMDFLSCGYVTWIRSENLKIFFTAKNLWEPLVQDAPQHNEALKSNKPRFIPSFSMFYLCNIGQNIDLFFVFISLIILKIQAKQGVPWWSVGQDLVLSPLRQGSSPGLGTEMPHCCQKSPQNKHTQLGGKRVACFCLGLECEQQWIWSLGGVEKASGCRRLQALFGARLTTSLGAGPAWALPLGAARPGAEHGSLVCDRPRYPLCAGSEVVRGCPVVLANGLRGWSWI